ncbi:MAG: hypothetical protein HY904_20900 [Deltaproteobacteria bacterium]|nr:hypothetical protein [Deltaproteobacteria bacterium]
MAEPTPSVPPAELLRSSSRARMFILVAFLLTRVAVLGAAHVGMATHPDRFKDEWSQPHAEPRPAAWMLPLLRFDVFYYQHIARYGYDEGEKATLGVAFFPLYPLLVRAVTSVVGDLFLAAVLLSNALALLAAWVMLRLGTRLKDVATGTACALLLLLAPGSGFLSYPYTESLFALLVAVAVLAIVDEKPAVAALAGALVTATRPNGVVVALMLALGAWQRRAELRVALRWLAAAVFSVAGLVAFAAFCTVRYGDPLAFSHVQQAWGRELSVLGPFKAFLAFERDPDFYVVALAALAMAVCAVGRVPAVLAAGGAFLVWLPLATGSLTSIIRFQSVNVPLLCATALLVRGRGLGVVLGVCGGLMLYEACRFGGSFSNN